MELHLLMVVASFVTAGAALAGAVLVARLWRAQLTLSAEIEALNERRLRDHQNLVSHIDRLWRAHVSTAMDVGPFWPLFAPSVRDAPPQGRLLTDVPPKLAARIWRESHDDGRQAVLTMLDQPDWRQHLVAAVWLVRKPEDEEVIEALWKTIEEGSWVRPQLLVVAKRVSSDFEERVDALWPRMDAKDRNAAAEILGDPSRRVQDDYEWGHAIARDWAAALERATM